MIRSELPDHWQELVAGYVLGDLSPAEVELLQQLLSEHPFLATEIATLQEVYALLPYALPQEELPTSLKTGMLDAIQLDSALPDAAPKIEAIPITSARSTTVTDRGTVTAPTTLSRRRPAWDGGGGAIAATIILALGIQAMQLQQDVNQSKKAIARLKQDLQTARQQVQEKAAVVAALQQPGAIVFTLEGTNQAASAAGSLVMRPNRQQMLLVVQNLPELPTGQVYRLWAKAAAVESVVYCGQFNSNDTGLVEWTAPKVLSGNAPRQMLITVDAVTTPPIRGGSLVMHSRI